MIHLELFSGLGKFPWGEILLNTIGTISGYFAGRYRSTTKNKARRKDD